MSNTVDLPAADVKPPKTNPFVLWFKIYLHGMKTALASRMAYRADFFMSIFIMMIVEMFGPLITLLIYSNGASFPGWQQHEVLLLQGVFLLSRASLGMRALVTGGGSSLNDRARQVFLP